MNAQELYKALDKAGIDYEVIEVFEGSRLLRFEVAEQEETEQSETA